MALQAHATLVPMASRKVLVAFAHPDDADIGIGGSIALWARQGDDVTYVVASDGSAGSNEPGATREEISRIRMEEQRAAARVLGVQDVRFLGYRDGYLVPNHELRRDLTREVRRVRPDLVVAPDPTLLWIRRGEEGDTDYVNHPDHLAVGQAMLAVMMDAPTRPQFEELLEEGLEPYDVPELWLTAWGGDDADTAVDISAVMNTKIEAVAAHASQMRNMGKDDPGEWIRAFGKAVGELHGLEYAEAFRTFRLKGNEDAKEDAREGDAQASGVAAAGG
jgi:LmbE family N-acetylglucosaminyl deacetylase